MDDAALVGVVDGTGQHLDDLRRLLVGQRRALQSRGQAAAGDELQREVRLPFVFADLVELDDVRVLELRHRPRLGQKARPMDRPSVVAGEDHLQGHQAVELRVPRLVDDAHAAPAQLREDLVIAERRQTRHVGDRSRQVRGLSGVGGDGRHLLRRLAQWGGPCVHGVLVGEELRQLGVVGPVGRPPRFDALQVGDHGAVQPVVVT